MDCSEKKFNWKHGLPAVGWWPTKREHDKKWSGTYRWCDGESWSYPAFEHENSQKAAHWASKKDESTKQGMMWSEWPQTLKTQK